MTNKPHKPVDWSAGSEDEPGTGAEPSRPGSRVSVTTFDEWFWGMVGGTALPHPWQRSLVDDDAPRSRIVRIPTGMGKTLGVLAAWSWHRVGRADNRWPRRLVWCLPMRVLVEQTVSVAREAIERMGLLWDGRSSHSDKVGVHVLMGGAARDNDWHLYPEECAVLVGTQDMLLSRALNRGYAAGRARWPLEFGLLSHDALWVMDEVQLMDVGLATSAQLQAYHDEDQGKGHRPRQTWWMSATLQPGWLKSVDTTARWSGWVSQPTALAPSQRNEGLGSIRKRLFTESVAANEAKVYAQRVLDEHKKLSDGDNGRITLAICNTVDRACQTYVALRKLDPRQELELVHSRFRPVERVAWRERFLSRAACSKGADRIIVATQVVEAGVDISAGCVVTDLAPWPSLVQRFGRCARYGGSGSVLVVDRGRDDKTAPPYAPEELDAAWAALKQLEIGSADVGIATLEEFEEGLDEQGRKKLYPYDPQHLLLRRELDELFDTTPDLTGADLDISRFIRSGDERDVQVFWRNLDKIRGSDELAAYTPSRDELCAVPFLRARDWLCGQESKSIRKSTLLKGKAAWIWDWVDGRWIKAERSKILPGRIICVAPESGGYTPERGFDSSSSAVVPEVPVTEETSEDRADNAEDAEDLSIAAWKTIACHGGEVAEEAGRICDALKLDGNIGRIVRLAGLWHDLGKAHPAFQGAIRPREQPRPDRHDLAKAPDNAWLRPRGSYRTLDDRDRRPGLRHELASALALFAVLRRHAPQHPALLGPWAEALRLIGQTRDAETAKESPTPCEQAVLDCSAEEFDLLAYLVACHHGKVRVALHAGPKDQDYRDPGDGRGLPIRGVREGDTLPSIKLDKESPPLPGLTLTLEPANLGLSPSTGRSWRERTLGLLDRFGPGTLAWMEALIIAADRRASRLTTPDPELSSMLEARS